MATILIAEDDAQMRAFVRTVLELEGHSVLEASDGVEALDLARAHPVSLVVADVVMPRMGGRELAWRISELSRDVPVILVSGMLAPDHVDPDVSPVAYLGKPFTRTELVDAVAEALRGS